MWLLARAFCCLAILGAADSCKRGATQKPPSPTSAPAQTSSHYFAEPVELNARTLREFIPVASGTDLDPRPVLQQSLEEFQYRGLTVDEAVTVSGLATEITTERLPNRLAVSAYGDAEIKFGRLKSAGPLPEQTTDKLLKAIMRLAVAEASYELSQGTRPEHVFNTYWQNKESIDPILARYGVIADGFYVDKREGKHFAILVYFTRGSNRSAAHPDL